MCSEIVRNLAIISLIQLCQSLQSVSVNKVFIVLYAAHSFIVANKYKLEIVKVIPDCDEHQRDAYYFWSEICVFSSEDYLPQKLQFGNYLTDTVMPVFAKCLCFWNCVVSGTSFHYC